MDTFKVGLKDESVWKVATIEPAFKMFGQAVTLPAPAVRIGILGVGVASMSFGRTAAATAVDAESVGGVTIAAGVFVGGGTAVAAIGVEGVKVLVGVFVFGGTLVATISVGGVEGIVGVSVAAALAVAMKPGINRLR
jgi:hypothetical protein